MRIKNHKVDFIASDKKVKTLKDFIKLTRSSMKNFNDVDKGAYNEYLKQLEESIA
jgi:glutaredoxin-related protein